ncbi:hypothetical protein SGGMMB4_01612 [Sodalis glossinidius str. 'morsitans']|uniref:Uncharacterized protein n=2 Tax=Sodalis glossinidius TaxID=63612 RepID=A0A193QH72_SODGM|nr:hypothetical protein SGGMMB4_01612 [Sodalis glossinidius str. 'morsitans']
MSQMQIMLNLSYCYLVRLSIHNEKDIAMNNKPTARQLAFEYLRRLSEELSPADYLKKFEQLESEFSALLHTSNSSDKTTGLCEFLSRFCPKRKADSPR